MLTGRSSQAHSRIFDQLGSVDPESIIRVSEREISLTWSSGTARLQASPVADHPDGALVREARNRASDAVFCDRFGLQ
jgi:hypothetical protein